MPRRYHSPGVKHGKTVVEMYDQDDRTLRIWVDYEYHKGSNDYFDKSFGNWLPGDPPEFNFTIIKHEAEPGFNPKLVEQILNDDKAIEAAVMGDGTGPVYYDESEVESDERGYTRDMHEEDEADRRRDEGSDPNR